MTRTPRVARSSQPWAERGAIPSGLNPAALHPKKLVALGLEPAVSPISNRQNVATTIAPRRVGHPQAGSPAIQQVGKPALRPCPRALPDRPERYSGLSGLQGCLTLDKIC